MEGAPDKEIWEALESAGTVDGLDGVAVVEVVIHTRAGPVFPQGLVAFSHTARHQ